MKKCLLLFVLLMPIMAFAKGHHKPAHADIKCYSDGKIIYTGSGTNIDYYAGAVAFMEDKSNQLMFIVGDCIVRLR